LKGNWGEKSQLLTGWMMTPPAFPTLWVLPGPQLKLAQLTTCFKPFRPLSNAKSSMIEHQEMANLSFPRVSPLERSYSEKFKLLPVFPIDPAGQRSDLGEMNEEDAVQDGGKIGWPFPPGKITKKCYNLTVYFSFKKEFEGSSL